MYQEMINVFTYLDYVIRNKNVITEEDKVFLDFAYKHLLYDYDDHVYDLLPTLVFSYIKPSMGNEFILHILLSMGRFITERELLLNASLRDCFRSAKLIGTSDNSESL